MTTKKLKITNLLTLLLMAVPLGAAAQGTATVNASDTAAHTDLLMLPSRSTSAEVSINGDTSPMTIGDQRTVTITVRNLSDNKEMRRVGFPPLETMDGGPIEFLESELDTVRSRDGRMEQIDLHLTYTVFDQGRFGIKTVVEVEEADGPVLLAPSDSMAFTVQYVAEADTTRCEVMPDAAYENEPYTFWEIFRWVLLALLVAAAVAAIVWIAKRRKEHKPIVVLPKAKPVPADRRALNELETLRRKELWQKGRVKKYYTDMTDIVRRFLHNMYDIAATEMTSKQTLRAFHRCADWSQEGETLLTDLLHQADMVKFAKSQPESYEHDAAMQNAINFVRQVATTHQINNPEPVENKK